MSILVTGGADTSGGATIPAPEEIIVGAAAWMDRCPEGDERQERGGA